MRLRTTNSAVYFWLPVLLGLAGTPGGHGRAAHATVEASAGDSAVVNGMQYSGIRILGIRDGELEFETIGGKVNAKPIGSVSRITLADEPALNAAEDAFAKSDWNKAAENYGKVIRSITEPEKAWLREWCSARLLDSAGKSGRFDVSIAGFIELAKKSPQQAKTMFAALKLPAAGSDYLKQAAAGLETAAAQSRSDASTEVLLSALRDVYMANNDAARAAVVARKLAEVAARRNPNSAEAVRALMEVKLEDLRKALAAKQYVTVIQTIQKDAATIIDPNDQMEALYLLAEAKAGLAAAAANADWGEVAIAYMRIVANARSDDPRLPTALLRVAKIHAEHLGDKATANRLYKEIISKYGNSEAAKEAQKLVGSNE